LAHIVCYFLAVGAYGNGAVSDHLACAVAIQNNRDSRGRSTGDVEIDNISTGSAFKRQKVRNCSDFLPSKPRRLSINIQAIILREE
jgi:hypothetical protein